MSPYLPPATSSSASRQALTPPAEKTLPRSRGSAAHFGDDATDRPPDFELLLASPPLNFYTPGATAVHADLTSAGSTPYLSALSAENVTMSLTTALHAELAARNDLASHGPFSFSLQLPQLGGIDVRMSTLQPIGWEVMLRFQRSPCQQVLRQRESCRRALSSALGCPIRLGFEVQEEP
ncbi:MULTISPECIES: type III secretion system HrpP C-terminal domain-containing protein [Lonsdalea]|uniref:Uncharacterized protein n=2 Tax=Lonsdalea TaxID=1082702 RepID=A0ACD1JG17_9GAMM|nr:MULTISPECIES: type III secretion system HrpP C-terminal domain-containing protein [Lonsdalea]OSM99582.1 hypothetical protein AU508_01005 [Lonsdalea populi]OSN02643.1 hypothetical protein AU499_00615 [Lonsdalea populi]RAT16119.1 hypothetical protein AU485_01505 [Lonsdalea quercina]RAT18124.1 hypothetical protein AU486_02060 [Lonsdalea quercina]RAT21280.1 hypothetical protein AU489_14940 [Lonsdalea populi]